MIAVAAAVEDGPRVGTAAARNISAFHKVIQGLRAKANELSSSRARYLPNANSSADAGGIFGTVPWLLLEVLKDTGYQDWLKFEQADGQERWRNIRELANLAAAGKSTTTTNLEAFLDSVALLQDTDSLLQSSEQRSEKSTRGSRGGAKGSQSEKKSMVKLLTIHSSKGMEFDNVFVTGVEEDLLPHFHSINKRGCTEEDIDEERRLLFVAMTRSKSKLYLSHASSRLMWGLRKNTRGSRFLDDIQGVRRIKIK